MVQSFKYLGVKFPLTRLQTDWNSCYMFENQCNRSDPRVWEVKMMLFNAMIVHVLLYGGEVWGGIMSLVNGLIEKI